MSTWRGLEIGVIVIASVVGGVAAAQACAWVLARVGRRLGGDPQIAGLIAEKGARDKFVGVDEGARKRSDRRRQLAEELRRDSRRIVTKDDRPGDRLWRAK